MTPLFHQHYVVSGPNLRLSDILLGLLLASLPIDFFLFGWYLGHP